MNDKLISLSDYNKKLYTIAKDKSKFVGVKGSMIGKSFLKALDFNLIIKHEIKHIFINRPTFEKYTEVDETYRKIIKLFIPSEDRWDHLCELLE